MFAQFLSINFYALIWMNGISNFEKSYVKKLFCMIIYTKFKMKKTFLPGIALLFKKKILVI